MLTTGKAEAIAQDWIDAWNAHDLERVMAHYADDLHFESPLIVARLDRSDGVIRTKSELRDYFAASLGPESQLRFDLEQVFTGVSSLTMIYRNHRGQRVAETKILNADGKATAVHVTHTPA